MTAKFDKKNTELTINEYFKIKTCLDGLNEIINVGFDEDEIYYQMAIDNLKNLNENIIKLLTHLNSPREIRIKLRELEFELEKEENTYSI